MFKLIEVGGDVDAPLGEFTTFPKAVRACLERCSLLEGKFEIWWVRRYKRQNDEVWLEAEFEALP